MKRDPQLKGKSALVTGDNDIATAIRAALAAEGCVVTEVHSGPVDILVNAAADLHAPSSTPLELESWADDMERCFEAPRGLAHSVLPGMIENKFGRIINVIGSFEPMHFNSGFAAWGAMAAWSKSLTRKVGQHGITVNCVQPGLIETSDARAKEFEANTIPAGRLGKPADIANFVVYLASGYAHYITGTVIPIDGGLSRYQH
jgi:3-oxoacyl-[acyl-carrier protein] reductase